MYVLRYGIYIGWLRRLVCLIVRAVWVLFIVKLRCPDGDLVFGPYKFLTRLMYFC